MLSSSRARKQNFIEDSGVLRRLCDNGLSLASPVSQGANGKSIFPGYAPLDHELIEAVRAPQHSGPRRRDQRDPRLSQASVATINSAAVDVPAGMHVVDTFCDVSLRAGRYSTHRDLVARAACGGLLVTLAAPAADQPEAG